MPSSPYKCPYGRRYICCCAEFLWSDACIATGPRTPQGQERRRYPATGLAPSLTRRCPLAVRLIQTQGAWLPVNSRALRKAGCQPADNEGLSDMGARHLPEAACKVQPEQQVLPFAGCGACSLNARCGFLIVLLDVVHALLYREWRCWSQAGFLSKGSCGSALA